MTKLEQAKELLESGKACCVIFRGEELLLENGIGVKPLMKYLREDREFFAGAVVADKIIGKAAALLLSNAAEVYGSVMSETAQEVFDTYQVPYSCGERVPFIQNRTRTGMCPLEDAVRDISDPAKGFDAIEARIAELMRK